MKKKILPLIIAVILLTGCGCKKGEIYEKEFREARTWVQMVPIIHTNGKTSWTQMVPIVHSHPDEYIIKIRSLDGKDVGTYYVEKEVYDECEVGMMFEYDKERGDLKEEPLTKKEKKK